MSHTNLRLRVGLDQNIIRCIKQLERTLLFAPGLNPYDEFVSTLRKVVNADAASIFLQSPNDPQKIEFTAGEGYDDEYRQSYYMRDDEFLTSFVYRTSQPINESVKSLEAKAEKGEIPYQGRCKFFLLSGEFRSLIAVPLVSGSDSCIGVLKLENKVGIEQGPFPEQDFVLARILAAVFVLATEQTRRWQLWDDVERAKEQCKNLASYAQEVTRIIAQYTHAEHASLFLTKEKDHGSKVLERIGGRECVETASSCQLKGGGTLAGYVASAYVPVCEEAKNLETEGLPVSQDESEAIEKGIFRNVLALPMRLVLSDKQIGILKVENKLPEDAKFNSIDMEVCRNCVQKQIAPALLDKFLLKQRGRRRETKGFQLLTSHIGSMRLKSKGPLKPVDLELVRRVREIQENEAEVKLEDCLAFLSISRGLYYKLIRESKSETSQEAGKS